MSSKKCCNKIFTPLVKWNLIAMAIVGIGIGIGLWVWMEKYTMHGEGVDVPEVKGMMLSDAEYALGKAGLVAVVVDSAYVRDQAVGVVLEQKPDCNSCVKPGREIYLTINQKQMPTNTIPDLAGNCSRREAEARLRALGFKLGPIELVPGDPDWVMALKVGGREVYPGERVPCDVPVVLVVGDNTSDDDFYDESMDGSTDNNVSADGEEDYEEEL